MSTGPRELAAALASAARTLEAILRIKNGEEVAIPGCIEKGIAGLKPGETSLAPGQRH